MSEFDKEAERERLREKYERDEKKREATQRMSELLLKGATMTNSHCETCGDPIFRYEGQEFCPTCRAEGGEGESTATETATTEADTAPEGSEPAERAADATPQPADSPEPSVPTVPERERRPAPRQAGGSSTEGRDRTLAGTRAAESAPDDSARGRSESVDAARGSLVRTLARFSRAAEETEDPRRAADLLGAAREAAATLSELENSRP